MFALHLWTLAIILGVYFPLSVYSDTPPLAAAAAAFKHPGVFVSKPQLDFVKSKVNAQAEPWTTAYNELLKHKFASLNRNPTPQAAVKCDESSSNDVGNGCHNEREDALAAWATALIWYISGDSRYAKKSISYLDGWSSTLKSHDGKNRNLQMGWAGTSWARAAELIRYSNAGWSNDGISKFKTMLQTQFLPTAVKSDARTSNWDLGESNSSRCTWYIHNDIWYSSPGDSC